MTTRRELIRLALLAPWLSACGGGNGNHNPGPERPIGTTQAADDWPSASPASQGIAGAAMQVLLDDGASIPYLYSMLVVRNGQMIGERYYNGAVSSDLRSVASVTKTVGSMLIGQALAEGKLHSSADTLATLLPNELIKTPNAYAAGITLQQVLDMTGGQQWDEDVRVPDATGAADLTAFALALPADGKIQGKTWNYTTATSHLVSPILRNATGMDELALATSKLFGPLGITRSAWSRDATGMVHGSFGLQLRTRDLMKLAWMVLQAGQWQDRSIVPAAWLAESLAPHVRGLGDDGELKNIGYGNLWWSGNLGGEAVHLAWGYGGQYAVLVPRLNLAIATAAEYNVDSAKVGAHHTAILNLIGHFVRSAQA